MDSAGLRRRIREDNRLSNNVSMRSVEDSDMDTGEEDSEVSTIPRYTINLDLPPAKRYEHVAMDFKFQAADLPVLFDELVQDYLPAISVSKIRMLARIAMRRVHNKEENEELRGISRLIGIEMWLLVALNVLLDMFMGCTSGGVRVEHSGESSRMLHFRTLDWGMDPLRKIVIHLDFVERAGGKVIASSLGYFGYVGVLTGVRKGLSMSLNFRPNHDASSKLANFRFYSHIVLVLLGCRPSISSVLRRCLLPSQTPAGTSNMKARTLDSIEQSLPGTTTTAAYLIFCDGDRTVTVEKDHRTAVIRSSPEFIVATNHDAAEETYSRWWNASEPDSTRTLQTTGMEGIVDESMSRKSTVVKLWEKSLGKTRRNPSQRLTRPRQTLTKKKIAEWLDTYPITNEETHFATIMDPMAGQIIWTKRYFWPLDFNGQS